MGSSPSLLQGSIPFFLCTSPICQDRGAEGAQLSCELEGTSAGGILHRRRRRKRRPRKKELLDSDSDSCDETKKEPCELPAPR